MSSLDPSTLISQAVLSINAIFRNVKELGKKSSIHPFIWNLCLEYMGSVGLTLSPHPSFLEISLEMFV